MGTTMPQAEAEDVLGTFDREHQRAAREGFGGVREGLGGGTSATQWATAHPDWPALRRAVLALSSESERVMLGVCADAAPEGVAALKAWVGALGLPRGRLHGMDRDGEPLDMTDFGAVYIKYSSAGGQVSESGDAMLNGYAGSFRGVYFNPQLADGAFRQYAVLPLLLFGDQAGAAPAGAEGPGAEGPAAHGPVALPTRDRPPPQEGWTKERVEALVARKLGATLAQLGASLGVAAVDGPSASVCLDLAGPGALKAGITDLLQREGLRRVVFHPDTLESSMPPGSDGSGPGSVII